jgi:UDP-glucose 4-epimerase
VFNVGSTEEVTILELARRIIELTGSSSQVCLTPYAEAYGEGFEDMYRRIPAIEKVRSLIGWSPAHSLEDIIREVAEDGRKQSGFSLAESGYTR